MLNVNSQQKRRFTQVFGTAFSIDRRNNASHPFARLNWLCATFWTILKASNHTPIWIDEMQQLLQSHFLDAHQAGVIVDGAETKAQAMGLAVVIAVMDAGSHLKVLHRMDGAVLASIDIAIRKATTAVMFQCNSEDVWEYCKPGAPAHGLERTNGGLAPFGGGIPLKTSDGTVIGAVGVSGGAVVQDLEVAQAGLAAFDALNS